MKNLIFKLYKIHVLVNNIFNFIVYMSYLFITYSKYILLFYQCTIIHYVVQLCFVNIFRRINFI